MNDAQGEASPADLVLATYNARYTHASLGLRWLLANLGPEAPSAAWHEFDLRVPPDAAAEQIQAHQPKLLALGVYIWNVRKAAELIRILRGQNPDLMILLGGPEVSAEPERFPEFTQVDGVIAGEAESVFGSWCRRLLAGEQPPQKVIHAPLPDLASLKLPYMLYSDADLKTRHIYVETTRGCPHHCDFCVSGDQQGIREFPLEESLDAICALADRGARTLRFVDRTFNARPDRAARILDRLRPWADQGLRLHLEFTPHAVYREDLREALCAWPPGALHIELGVQTLNDAVSRRVRRPGIGQAEQALRFLLDIARAEVHADLIVGLPGETWDSISDGFDRLVALRPQEVQLGLLKKLPGTTLDRHCAHWGLVFDTKPPYSLQSNALLSSEEIDRLQRFAAYWERLANHNPFPNTLPMVLAGHRSAFAAFMHLSDWLFAGFGRTHSLSLDDLCAALFAYLTYELRHDHETARRALAADFLANGRRPERALPKCLRCR